MAAARAAHRCDVPGRGLGLKEWERSGWTYHAKGVWVRPSPDVEPALTLLGSTNLSARSAELDAEMSFVVVGADEVLRKGLGEEVKGLWEYAMPWMGEERRVRLGTKALVRMVGGML
jgi:CDP-diacylglycerol---glycerol-3-phosphate 3-phosphatidyltransferase